MIYLFNKKKELQRIVPRKHLISAIQIVERNGVYQLTAEMPSFYVDKDKRETNYKKLVEDASFIGHYDLQKRFQIYKIYGTNLTADNRGERLIVDAVHIFFDEAKALGNIHDRRFRNSEAKAAADVAFNAIGWQVMDYDVTDRHDINFYRDSVTNAWNKLIETFGVEFDYEVKFDGQKVVSKNVIMKKAIGRWTGERFAYGTNILSLTQEQDEAEIYTAAVGRGRGEEAGDGYGPRLEFGDIEWSKDGIQKPIGQNWIEIPSATLEYGYYINGEIKPRIAPEVVFENIENPVELANATYQWLLENCVPKATWTTNVAKIGELNLGDGVGIIYKRAGIVKQSRVEKIEHNLLDPSLSKLTLGDFKHFKNRQLKRLNSQIKRANRDARSLITQLKEDFDAWFNAQAIAFRNEFEQAKIDILAEVEADRARMEAEFNQTIDTWTNVFNQDVENAMKYAEEQAKAHANAVEIKLDTVTGSHAGMLADLQSNVMNIDEFIGQRDKTLQQILDEERQTLEQKIEIYNKNYPNLVVGSTLENIDGFEPYQTTEIELRTEESLNYIRTYDVEGRNNLAYYFPDTVYLEQGNTYTLGVDFRSDSVEDLDYIYFMSPYNNVALTPLAQTRGLTADGTWHRYYFTFVWVDTTRHARLMIGTNFNLGDTTRGWFDTRQVHVYKGDIHNIPWTPSPSDNAQVVSQLLYEMRQLEDGMSTLATKTEVDLLTGNVTQLTNEYLSTSEQVSSKLQNFDDVLGVNGSHFTQIADQVQSKVWLNDVTDINPNLIPFADVRNISDMHEYWSRFGANPSGSHATALDSDGFYVFRDTVAESNLALESSTFEEITEGGQYTLSFQAKTHANINFNYNYTYIINPNGTNHHLGIWTNRKHIRDNIYLYEWTFDAEWTGAARVLIGSTTTAGTDASIRFKEPKLERGSKRTPFLNAFSNIEQLANKIALQVQELDGEFLTQSDIRIESGYVQLGSQRLGDDQLASILRVSPNSINAITDNLNLTGNLNVKGQIEAMALNAINVNAGTVRSYILESNVITGNHLAVGTTMVDKLFATSGRIDQLITKDHFVRNMKALSIEAVEGNFSSLMTKYLSANYIDVDYINGKNAWFESMYTSNAMIARLTAQHAFIRDVQAIEITANQLNLDTLRNRFNQIEGGIHITRAVDGVRWIENGVPRGNVPVQTYDSYAGANIRFNGLNYITNYSHWQTFKYFYTPHEGRILRVVWAVGLLGSSGSSSEYVEVQVNGFGNNNQINNGAGSSSRRVFVSRGDTVNITQDIPLPPPNYNMMQAYLQVRRSPSGTGVQNDVFARILHIGQYG